MYFVFTTVSHFSHSALEFVGEVATAYPRTWIYSFAAAGMALAIAIYGGLGLWLGGLFGHPTGGMYLGLAWYGYWFLENVEEIKSQADGWVNALESIRSQLK